MNVKELGNAKLKKLRRLLDKYIQNPTLDPVQEHKHAGADMSLMIHGAGFVAWHQHFLAELENWLLMHGGMEFVPLPYWNPAEPIPVQLNKNNNSDLNLPLPKHLRAKTLKSIATNFSTRAFFPIMLQSIMRLVVRCQIPIRPLPIPSFGHFILFLFRFTNVGE